MATADEILLRQARKTIREQHQAIDWLCGRVMMAEHRFSPKPPPFRPTQEPDLWQVITVGLGLIATLDARLGKKKEPDDAS